MINQNYPDTEHIIIDAGSTDETIRILKKYDKYLNWTSEPDGGQSEGLNKGFKRATGDIIGWFNSDDRVPPNALNMVAEFFIANKNEIAVIGDQALIDEEGIYLRTVKSHSYSYDFLLNYAKGITQNSIFFKREVFNAIGYLDEGIHYAMDRDFFIRVARIKSIPYLEQVLGEFRIQSDAKTAQGSYLFAKDLVKIRKRYGGRFFCPGNTTDYYIIFTEPLRRIACLRKFVQRARRLL